RKTRRRYLQRQRRSASAAARGHRLRGAASPPAPSPRGAIRAGRALADGAEFLWREQARAEREDQSGAWRAARLSDLSRRADGVSATRATGPPDPLGGAVTNLSATSGKSIGWPALSDSPSSIASWRLPFTGSASSSSRSAPGTIVRPD